MLALREERLRAQQRPDIAGGQASEGVLGSASARLPRGLEERLTVPEDKPPRCRGVDDGIQKGLGRAKPGKAIERVSTEIVDVSRQVGTCELVYVMPRDCRQEKAGLERRDSGSISVRLNPCNCPRVHESMCDVDFGEKSRPQSWRNQAIRHDAVDMEEWMPDQSSSSPPSREMVKVT